MTTIKSESEYKVILERIEELLKLVDNDTSNNDKNLFELTLLSNLVADYEEVKYPISQLSFTDVMKLLMSEMELNHQ